MRVSKESRGGEGEVEEEGRFGRSERREGGSRREKRRGRAEE